MRRQPGQPVVVLLCLLWALAAALPAGAQDVPRDPEAELVFEQGLEAFEAGDYGMAYRRFRHLYERLPLNRKTTAAVLMAGKAAYREGDLDRAERVLTALVDGFPTTTYADEARETLGFVRQAREAEISRPEVLTLGIALPLRSSDVSLTQSMFNGLRIAVEAHNEARPDRPARMVFRDTRGTAAGAAEAVRSLAVEGVDVIVGPIYSEEAEAAGAAAERAGVLLVAPLATDESVSEARDWVFQANPTYTMRGRLMARFALDNLRLRRFGIAAELGEYGERLAEGFQDEVIGRGGDVAFFRLLDDASAWAALPEAVGSPLGTVDALYLPVTGRRARQSVREVLVALQGTSARPRVLGNGEWADLNTQARADLFGATYTSDFHVGAPTDATRAFESRYAALAGRAPSGQARRLAYTGYDVTRFVLAALADAEAGPDALRAAPRYEGLGLRIDFEGGNVNEAIFFMRYRAGNSELLK